MSTALKLGPADHGRTLTPEEYFAGDYRPGFKYELIRGRLEVSPLPDLPANHIEEWLLDLLKARGCRIGAVTMGERGMLWYDETGRVDTLPSLDVPASRIIDTSGAGDVFHGAYVWSYLTRPEQPWIEHFTFARAASAHKIQHLGNEAGLPQVEDVERAMMAFTPKG